MCVCVERASRDACESDSAQEKLESEMSGSSSTRLESNASFQLRSTYVGKVEEKKLLGYSTFSILSRLCN